MRALPPPGRFALAALIHTNNLTYNRDDATSWLRRLLLDSRQRPPASPLSLVAFVMRRAAELPNSTTHPSHKPTAARRQLPPAADAATSRAP